MKKPNRIGIDLFDEDLKELINASAKIFPLTQDMIDNNLNPDNYEFGKFDRSIYKWFNNKWEYIVADDIDINWNDVKNKPIEFPPSSHEHINDHSHENKSILDLITQVLIDSWNTVTSKAEQSVVSDIDNRLLDIESGHTEGHSHPNVNILNSITSAMIDIWNSVTNKSDKDYVDNELIKKANSSTLNGHIDNTTIHVTQTDKNNWNAKLDAEDVPSGITIGTTKPTDGSMWYQEI